MRAIVRGILVVVAIVALWGIVWVGLFLWPPSTTSIDRIAFVQQHADELIAEAEQLLAVHEKTGAEFFDQNTPLPPLMTRLQPLLVSVDRRSSTSCIDVRFSGGFQHWGVIIVPPPADPEPLMGMGKFRHRRLHPRIEEYRE